MNKTLFRNVSILGCTGALPFPGSVLVEGNRIAIMKEGIFWKAPADGLSQDRN